MQWLAVRTHFEFSTAGGATPACGCSGGDSDLAADALNEVQAATRAVDECRGSKGNVGDAVRFLKSFGGIGAELGKRLQR